MFEDRKEKEYLIIMENPLLKLNNYKIFEGVSFEEVNSNDGETFCTISTATDKPSIILESNSKLYFVKNDKTFTKIDRDNPLVLPIEVKEDVYLIDSDKLPAYFIWDIIFTICFILGIGEVQKVNDSDIIRLSKNEFNHEFGRLIKLFTAKLTISKDFDIYKNSEKEYIKCTNLFITPYGTYLDKEELEGLDYELEETPKVIRGVMKDLFDF